MAPPDLNQMEQFRRRLVKFKKEECGRRVRVQSHNYRDDEQR